MDDQVKNFYTYKLKVSKIKSLFKTISCLCPGLTIELTNDNGRMETKIFIIQNMGLNDLTDEAH